MEKFQKTKVQVQPVLKLYLDLSQTNYLHFGMWNPGDELNLLNFQAAQERYAQRLISFTPPQVKTILDVGCGVGGNSIAFTKAGFSVKALSPDPYQQQLYKERTGGKTQFYLTTLENFKSDEKFDMLLLSESVQYIKEEDIFRKADELLKPGGYLLTSDYYKNESAKNVENLPGHLYSKWLDEMKKSGYKIIKEEDITEFILPTLDYGNIVYRNYIKPVLRCILTTLEVHLPPIYWMFNLVMKFRVKGKSLRQIIINNVVPLERETFKKYLSYRIQLLQKVR